MGNRGNLIEGDGINKTLMWKKCAAVRNFADARTFPIRHAGANSAKGLLFIHDHTGDG